jgi:hypothetical protein
MLGRIGSKVARVLDDIVQNAIRIDVQLQCLAHAEWYAVKAIYLLELGHAKVLQVTASFALIQTFTRRVFEIFEDV